MQFQISLLSWNDPIQICSVPLTKASSLGKMLASSLPKMAIEEPRNPADEAAAASPANATGHVTPI
jgi:hypothetical protein